MLIIEIFIRPLWDPKEVKMEADLQKDTLATWRWTHSGKSYSIEIWQAFTCTELIMNYTYIKKKNNIFTYLETN